MKQNKIGDTVGVFNKESPNFTFNGKTGKILAVKYEIDFGGGLRWTIDQTHIVEGNNEATEHGIALESKAIEAYAKVKPAKTEPKAKRPYNRKIVK